MITHFRQIGRTAFAVAACSLIGTSLALAQASRTWVSGVGDDANPCSRTAPCKTYAGAISKTATGGEISTLDPGGFGALTITKAITINGDGTLASITASGTNGIIINAPAGAAVTLRNISLNGLGTGLNGIRVLGGASITIERVDISGFTQAAIDVEPSTTSQVAIRDSSLHTCTTGVQVSQPAGRVDVSMTNVQIKHCFNAVENISGFTNVTRSTFTENSGTAILGNGGELTVEDSQISSNGTGAIANGTSVVRISNNGFYNNLTGFGCGPGQLASTGDNRKGGNVGGGAACSPNAVVNVQ